MILKALRAKRYKVKRNYNHIFNVEIWIFLIKFAIKLHRLAQL